VIKVIDGDTSHVLVNGTDYKVRYIDMNAPEDTTKKEWLGPEATARDTELVAGKMVTFVKDGSETDRYGRLLRFVFLDNVLVNYELVREGYVRQPRISPTSRSSSCFAMRSYRRNRRTSVGGALALHHKQPNSRNAQFSVQ
jgi:endonuclease YncB( thermonuclease family)